jgi:hypothetical protein
LLGFPEGDALGNPGLPQCVPEDAHRDNLAPLSPAHECPRTLDPHYPSYRIQDVWTTTEVLTFVSLRRDQFEPDRQEHVTNGGVVGRFSPSIDPEVESRGREMTHPRQRAKRRRLGATSLQLPTDTVPPRPRGRAAGE